MGAEGIDKISLRINAAFVNSVKWKFKGFIPGVYPISLSKSRSGMFYAHFHGEGLRLDMDIQTQLICGLAILYSQGYLILPCTLQDSMNFISENRNYLVLLDVIEFNFDFMRGDFLFSQQKSNDFFTTRYSSDYLFSKTGKRSASGVILYDRVAKEKARRHMPFVTLENMDYPIRLEFRLNRINSRYLNFENLHGTYEEVFRRFFPVLVNKWRRYAYEVGYTSLKYYGYNLHFNLINQATRTRVSRTQRPNKTNSFSIVPLNFQTLAVN